MTPELGDQLEWHWQHRLRPRLDGLTDDEYFWQPVGDCWTVHPDGSIDFACPPTDHAPFTTIAWRLAHVIVGVLAMRNHSHFGGPPADYTSWPYARDAHTALARPCGPAEGPYADLSMATLVLHINREVIHHGAEIACIRDLYTHTNNKEN
ncbi:MAG: DinB family protein [Mycobacterium sp.]